MQSRFLAVLFLLAVLFPCSALAKVKVYFSPHGGCDQAVVQLAQASKLYLDAACYTFTLDAIAEELIVAQQRGVKVRVILDRSQGSQQWSQGKKLLAAGIPIKVNSHSGLMHDKFLVADGKSVATGSFNWTNAAVQKNDENLLVFLDEAPVASTFAVQFDKMWQDTARFTTFTSRTPAVEPAAAIKQQTNTGSSDLVYITKSGKKYHREGCRYLARSSIPIARKDAEAKRLTPCKVCNP